MIDYSSVEVKLNTDWIIQFLERIQMKLERKLTEEEISKIIAYTIGYVDLGNDKIIREIIKELKLFKKL